MHSRERDRAHVIRYRHDRRRHALGLLALREQSAPRAGTQHERLVTLEDRYDQNNRFHLH